MALKDNLIIAPMYKSATNFKNATPLKIFAVTGLKNN